jgi:hypothetical protein
VKTNTAGLYRIHIPSGHATPILVSARGYAGALAVGTVKPHTTTRFDVKLNPRIPGKPNVPPSPGTFGKP